MFFREYVLEESTCLLKCEVWWRPCLLKCEEGRVYIWWRPCLLKCESGYVKIWQRPCVYASVTEVARACCEVLCGIY